MARNVIDSNRYLVLGTTEEDGHPGVPRLLQPGRLRDFYWVSSPDAQHSRNVDARSEVSFVIFNSTLLPTQGNQAVYVDATVEQIDGGGPAGAVRHRLRCHRAPALAPSPPRS